MGLSDDIKAEVAAIFQARWSRRDGRGVPDTEDIALGNDGVDLEAAVFYADLVDSTEMVTGYRSEFAAEVYKAFLIAACRVIRANNGEISAFDGDRVMAVFIGSRKNSSAAKAALHLNFVVRNIVSKAMKLQYPTTSFELKHVVGIDSGKLLVARTGIRNANDLVWVGRPANYAAKLCELREPGYSTYITADVYKKLDDGSKYSGSPRRSMWSELMWDAMGIPIYASKWTWEP